MNRTELNKSEQKSLSEPNWTEQGIQQFPLWVLKGSLICSLALSPQKQRQQQAETLSLRKEVNLLFG